MTKSIRKICRGEGMLIEAPEKDHALPRGRDATVLSVKTRVRRFWSSHRARAQFGAIRYSGGDSIGARGPSGHAEKASACIHRSKELK